jgi:hypothetical protein
MFLRRTLLLRPEKVGISQAVERYEHSLAILYSDSPRHVNGHQPQRLESNGSLIRPCVRAASQFRFPLLFSGERVRLISQTSRLIADVYLSAKTNQNFILTAQLIADAGGLCCTDTVYSCLSLFNASSMFCTLNRKTTPLSPGGLRFRRDDERLNGSKATTKIDGPPGSEKVETGLY